MAGLCLHADNGGVVGTIVEGPKIVRLGPNPERLVSSDQAFVIKSATTPHHHHEHHREAFASLSHSTSQLAISYVLSASFAMHVRLVSALLALSFASLVRPHPDPSRTLEERDNVVNTVWCGPVLAAAATKVSAEWTIPTVSLPDPNANPIPDLEFYQWVGIDGVHGSTCPEALLQGGTSQVVRFTCSGLTCGY